MTYKQDSKLLESITKHGVKCKCSHTVLLHKVDRTICSYCGRWVYKTPQIEFKYKMKENVKRSKDE